MHSSYCLDILQITLGEFYLSIGRQNVNEHGYLRQQINFLSSFHDIIYGHIRILRPT